MFDKAGFGWRSKPFVVCESLDDGSAMLIGDSCMNSEGTAFFLVPRESSGCPSLQVRELESASHDVRDGIGLVIPESTVDSLRVRVIPTWNRVLAPISSAAARSHFLFIFCHPDSFLIMLQQIKK